MSFVPSILTNIPSAIATASTTQCAGMGALVGTCAGMAVLIAIDPTHTGIGVILTIAQHTKDIFTGNARKDSPSIHQCARSVTHFSLMTCACGAIVGAAAGLATKVTLQIFS